VCSSDLAHTYVFTQARQRWGRWALLAGAAAGLAAVLMTMPWRLGPPAFSWDWDDAWHLSGLRRGVLFAVCGFFTAGAWRLRGGGPCGALLVGAALTSGLAAGVEAAQSVCRGHVAMAGHALSAALAGFAGCAASTLFAAPAVQRNGWFPLRRVAGAALVALLAYRIGTAAWAATADGPVAPIMHWAPFQAEFAAPVWIALAVALEQFTLYAVMTVTCLFAARRRGEAVALLLVLGCAAGPELVRALGGGGADTTPLVLAAAGWLTSVWAWRAVFPQHAAERRQIPRGAPARTQPDDAQGLHQPKVT
jgi:hypothetical protein